MKYLLILFALVSINGYSQFIGNSSIGLDYQVAVNPAASSFKNPLIDVRIGGGLLNVTEPDLNEFNKVVLVNAQVGKTKHNVGLRYVNERSDYYNNNRIMGLGYNYELISQDNIQLKMGVSINYLTYNYTGYILDDILGWPIIPRNEWDLDVGLSFRWKELSFLSSISNAHESGGSDYYDINNRRINSLLTYDWKLVEDWVLTPSLMLVQHEGYFRWQTYYRFGLESLVRGKFISGLSVLSQSFSVYAGMNFSDTFDFKFIYNYSDQLYRHGLSEIEAKVGWKLHQKG